MNKPLKVISIVVASLLAVIITTVSVLLWLVFTPDRLTPFIEKQAKQWFTCQSEVGSVELTFFSTFPHFGLKIKNFELISSVVGAPSDTLLTANEVVANIDISSWWKNKDIVLNQFRLNGLSVNAYVNEKGTCNFDVLPPSKESNDTTSVMNMFRSIRLEEVVLRDVNLSYVNKQNQLNIQANQLNSELIASLSGDNVNALFDMHLKSLSVDYAGESYLKNALLNIHIPLDVNLSHQSLTLHKADLSLNGITIGCDGSVQQNVANGDIRTNLTYSLSQSNIKTLLAIVPSRFLSMFAGTDMDGLLSMNGSVLGTFNKKNMPMITTHVELNQGRVKYDGFPLALHDVHSSIYLQTDLQTDSLSFVHIRTLGAKTPKSEISMSGRVNHLLSDMLCDLKIDVKASLSEFNSVIPTQTKLNVAGFTNGWINTKFTLSQLEKKDFANMLIRGNLALVDLKMNYDTLRVDLDRGSIDFSVPAIISPQVNKETLFLQLNLLCDNLLMNQGKSITANVRGTNLKMATSNVLKTNILNSVDCNFSFETMNATMDGNMSVNATHTLGRIGMSGYLNNINIMPTLHANLAMEDLFAVMDTISVHIKKPATKIDLQANKKNTTLPQLELGYQSHSLDAKMGKEGFMAGGMCIDANLVYDKAQKNRLLQWTPEGSVSLENGWLSMSGMSEGIKIPVVKFRFSPEKYLIEDSRILMGASDFQLIGELKNVASYVRGDSLLVGDFKFKSGSTDVNALMNLTSGIGEKEAQVENSGNNSKESSSGPFMVPKGITLNLETQIDQAFFKNDTARNIKGNVALNDGVLILDNMDFSTTAAKMHLTAMYKSPRKNHLYAGLDYHMTDVEISELLAMIPDIDSIMPMLRSFGGKGEFHMAVETNMDSLYRLKKSTLLGSALVKGENLVLMDGETFGEIAKMLRFNKKTQNRVDSLSAEFTIFKEEVDVYPFLIVMDKYKAVVGGRHNLDLSFNYNISLIDSPLPIRLGLDVYGTLEKMHFKLAKCRYSRLYRPVARKAVDKSQLELKKLIRDALMGRIKK